VKADGILPVPHTFPKSIADTHLLANVIEAFNLTFSASGYGEGRCQYSRFSDNRFTVIESISESEILEGKAKSTYDSNLKFDQC